MYVVGHQEKLRNLRYRKVQGDGSVGKCACYKQEDLSLSPQNLSKQTGFPIIHANLKHVVFSPHYFKSIFCLICVVTAYADLYKP